MNERTQELTAEIESRAGELARQSVRTACSGPFWDERFGERGLRYIDEDSIHHLDQLLTALSTGHPSVFARYARWLQNVLTHRGMCTLHIEDHFLALAAAIDDEGLDGAETARAYIQAGIEALRYDAGPARVIQEHADVLTSTAAAQAERLERGLPPKRIHHDAGFLLSYLSDALALEDPAVFVDYTSWIAPFHARHGASPHYLATLLTALDAALKVVPGPDREEAAELVAEAKHSVLAVK